MDVNHSTLEEVSSSNWTEMRRFASKQGITGWKNKTQLLKKIEGWFIAQDELDNHAKGEVSQDSMHEDVMTPQPMHAGSAGEQLIDTQRIPADLAGEQLTDTQPIHAGFAGEQLIDSQPWHADLALAETQPMYADPAGGYPTDTQPMLVNQIDVLDSMRELVESSSYIPGLEHLAYNVWTPEFHGASYTSASFPEVAFSNTHDGQPFMIGSLFPACRAEARSPSLAPTLTDSGTQTDDINFEDRPPKSPPFEERHSVLLSIRHYPSLHTLPSYPDGPITEGMLSIRHYPGLHTVPSYPDGQITEVIEIAAHANTKCAQDGIVENNASHHIMPSVEPSDTGSEQVETNASQHMTSRAESLDAGPEADITDDHGFLVEDQGTGTSEDDPIILDSDPMEEVNEFSREGTGTSTDPIILDPDVIGTSNIFTRELASRDTGSPIVSNDDYADSNELSDIGYGSVSTNEWLVPKRAWDKAYQRWARVVHLSRLGGKRLPTPFIEKMDDCEVYTKRNGHLPAEKGWGIYASWAACKKSNVSNINSQREKKALADFEAALEQIKRAIVKDVSREVVQLR
ncbi:hypothetical protein DM02DRAFT_675510 [Periconia macrospinosa]|uniref:Uncharacterized protein n=1 Tax=Periconia macrospinosa TaxID=97972 RepID=A0A2V1DE13_9PLEO|nr:hypothetical protein DM02DRAFT_675510 [Periconia macrospinosa]